MSYWWQYFLDGWMFPGAGKFLVVGRNFKLYVEHSTTLSCRPSIQNFLPLFPILSRKPRGHRLFNAPGETVVSLHS